METRFKLWKEQGLIVDYKTKVKLRDCRDVLDGTLKRTLEADGLVELCTKTCVVFEMDGEQHLRPVQRYPETFFETVRRDMTKDRHVLARGWGMARVSEVHTSLGPALDEELDKALAYFRASDDDKTALYRSCPEAYEEARETWESMRL